MVAEQLAVAERESRNLQVKLLEKQTELEDATRKLKSFDDSLTEKQKEVVNLKSELQLTSKDKREMMESFKTQLTAEFAEKTKETEQSLAEKTKELEELKARVAALETDVAQAKDDLKAQEDENKSLLTSLTTLQGKNLSLLERKVEEGGERKASEADPDAQKKLEMAAREWPSTLFSPNSWPDLSLLLLVREDLGHPGGEGSAPEGPEKGQALR